MGLLRAVQKAVPGIPIMVMIRPRIGDFLYSDAEFDVMLEDIELFKLTGAAGLVFGVLTAEGEVDILRTRSGQSPSITRLDDLPQIKRAIANHCAQYPHQTLLFGSGINPDTVEAVLASLAANEIREIHLTGGHWEDGGMRHRPGGMGMGASGHEWDIWSTSQHAIRAVRSHADVWTERMKR
ncbi:hypothetical protein HWV62_31797 [Athelia sp. TMB]|nr:hypothetical protein HWV62_31797 [Athelia sp. TMB]